MKTLNLDKKCILVTGSAGFIGNNLSMKLIGKCKSLICIDNMNPYYDPELKKSRKKRLDTKANLSNVANYHFLELDLKDQNKVNEVIKKYKPDIICHLAAQAGVRYSLDYPHAYVEDNITVTVNILEAAKENSIKDVIFASTSSVYGLNEDVPFNENISIDSTISTYAATKRSCELLCHTYNYLYDIRFRILRFFTVYGPWGRPDMALFLFTKSILNDEPIKVFNSGKMRRDFTYVDDITDGFLLAIQTPLDYEIINLGGGEPVELIDFIEMIEKRLGKKAKKELLPLQPGDVPMTSADISKARKLLGYNPQTRVKEGVNNFIDWYLNYYSN